MMIGPGPDETFLDPELLSRRAPAKTAGGGPIAREIALMEEARRVIERVIVTDTLRETASSRRKPAEPSAEMAAPRDAGQGHARPLAAGGAPSTALLDLQEVGG